jgi:hypothetical protein
MIDDKLIKKILIEATSDGGGRGSYIGPLQPGIRLFKKNQMAPFTIPVSKYDSPLLSYDSYDGKMDETKKQIKKIETKARKNSEYLKNHPNLTRSDEDGNVINQTPGKKLKFVPIKENMKIDQIIKKILLEATSEKSTRGSYVSPLLPGYREFQKNQNAPFTEFVNQWDDAMLDHDSLDGKMSTKKSVIKKREKRAEKIVRYIKNNPDAFTFADDGGVMNSIPGKNLDAKPLKNFDPKKTVTKLGEWVEITQDVIVEDLAVWFGKKKKPKGSSQPKGPWVDICRKVDGKHPPCGRSDASSGSYPKCRAAGVAGKMSDTQKRNACQQKRKAEKNDPQSGKGQKPVMTSYKTKKESVDSIVFNILSEIRNSF